ncbi:hypothetical protein BDW02DRAFT_571973 [Decorospora gaudefroyi]|uniref:Uncharacterized protein n=1 Tax=Decorospora gaudefroyi TaxID=184978 RepID=A0A6A5KAP4_9PLEO|nr:hypothetical protein BDW02DRAFT_571973 [Decorospora gaudefroyi]
MPSVTASTGTIPAEEDESLVRPSSDPALAGHLELRAAIPSPLSKLENLPVEIVDEILSYLIHPRSRLPGLTEAQSAHKVPKELRRSIKNQEDLLQPPDMDRWAADIFSLHLLSHPFNALALTSKRCNELVQHYASHLVRSCNATMFNLPFARLDKYGPRCVYPDLSAIVYRRLWLQHAPRKCIYCHVVLECYPFSLVKRVLTTCEDCFYCSTMTVDEVQAQYHLSPATVLASHHIRRGAGSRWLLRVDVEALAWQLYRTRAFHNAHKEQFGKPCSLCAITTFRPEDVKRSNLKRQMAKKRSTRRVRA